MGLLVYYLGVDLHELGEHVALVDDLHLELLRMLLVLEHRGQPIDLRPRPRVLGDVQFEFLFEKLNTCDD